MKFILLKVYLLAKKYNNRCTNTEHTIHNWLNQYNLKDINQFSYFTWMRFERKNNSIEITHFYDFIFNFTLYICTSVAVNKILISTKKGMAGITKL